MIIRDFLFSSYFSTLAYQCLQYQSLLDALAFVIWCSATIGPEVPRWSQPKSLETSRPELSGEITVGDKILELQGLHSHKNFQRNWNEVPFAVTHWIFFLLGKKSWVKKVYFACMFSGKWIVKGPKSRAHNHRVTCTEIQLTLHTSS